MNVGYGKTTDFVKGLRNVASYQFEGNNINPSFPEEIAKLKEEDFVLEACNHRKDFRGEKALTIDSADCKDMDGWKKYAKSNLHGKENPGETPSRDRRRTQKNPIRRR